MKVLFTRELDLCSIQKAQKYGVEIYAYPFISVEIEPLSEQIVQQIAQYEFSSWIFTSAHSARFAAMLLRSDVCKRPDRLYCIGENTASDLNASGIPVYSPPVATAASLAELIISREHEGMHCYFKGNRSLDVIDKKLSKTTIGLATIQCYRTELHPSAVDPTQYDAAAFYSPSAVQSFIKGGYGYFPNQLFAVGPTTAHELRKHFAQDVNVSAQPRFESLLACILQVNGKAYQE